MRDTFASNALAAGVTVFELARVMGTSVRMIEKHYVALLDGAHAGIAGQLNALDAELSAMNGAALGLACLAGEIEGAVGKPPVIEVNDRSLERSDL
jgi:hypothetical protein